MAVTGGPKAPQNVFENSGDAADNMAKRAQAGLAQNYADINVAYVESDKDRKEKDDERKRREAAETALRLAETSAALQGIINAAKIKMQNAENAIRMDTAYINNTQQGIDARVQNLANQGLSVLTLSTTGLDARTVGLQQGADAVIFRDQNGYYVNGAFGVGTLRLSEQQSAQVSSFAAQTGARNGSDPTVKAEAARLNMDFVQRDYVSHTTEKVTKQNYNEAAQTFQQATEAQQKLAANPKDPDAQRTAEEIIESNKTTTETTTDALAAPAPAPDEIFLMSEQASATIAAELIKNGSLDNDVRQKIADELGISVEGLMKLEQDLLTNDYGVKQAREEEKLDAPTAELASEFVAGIENARMSLGAVPALSGGTQNVMAKTNNEMQQGPQAVEAKPENGVGYRPNFGA